MEAKFSGHTTHLQHRNEHPACVHPIRSYRVHVGTEHIANFYVYREGKLCAFTKPKRHQFEAGVTRVALVASITLVIELIFLR